MRGKEGDRRGVRMERQSRRVRDRRMEGDRGKETKGGRERKHTVCLHVMFPWTRSRSDIFQFFLLTRNLTL